MIRNVEHQQNFKTYFLLKESLYRQLDLRHIHQQHDGAGWHSGNAPAPNSKVVGSNVGEVTGYSDLLQLQVNSGIVPRLSHDRFLPNPFPFINHPNLRRYAV
jgi:hypothetical protein